MTELRIARRFHGPPDSGNGGYVCGLIANALGGSGCTVRLLRPPPLDVALDLRTSDGEAGLYEGDTLVGLAVRAEPLEFEVPAPPELDEARAAEARFAGHHRHRFPSCFVCGPEREPGDGLAIFAGEAGGQVAATWTPAEDLADGDGRVRPEFLWAAMDCPGYFAVEEAAGLALLGQMTAEIDATVRAGEPLIVSGWGIRSEGRKHRVGTALHRPDGSRVARVQATWITVAA